MSSLTINHDEPAVRPYQLELPTPACFASDLHLSQHHPQTTQQFIKQLHECSQQAASIVLLGDVFDAWIGDDLLDDALQGDWLTQVIQALKTCAQKIPLWIAHGNRDFLLGAEFFKACKAHFLPELSICSLGGQETLLLHGDSLCQEDSAYQHIRAQVRQPKWQTAFLSHTLAERKQLAQGFQASSRVYKQSTTLEIMDASTAAVQALFEQCGALQMIHGHTHRPGLTQHLCKHGVAQRWVLSDWDYDSSDGPNRGNWLIATYEQIHYKNLLD